MKNIFLFLFYFTSFFHGFSQQVITICTQNNGCEFAKVNLTKSQIDDILGKPNFVVREKGVVIINLMDCVSTIEKNKIPQAIHEANYGKGIVKERKNFDLKKYLFEKGCLKKCSNNTKKISFQIKSDEFNGSAFSFLNIKAEESFMPNESWQKMSQGEMVEGVLNTFIKKNKNISYFIAEGKKWKVTTPYGAIFNDLNDPEFSALFHKRVTKTGNKKPFLKNGEIQYEYSTTDDEGNKMTFWLTLSKDVCFVNGKNIPAGFFNLGYILLDGITYLVTELSGQNLNIKIIDIEDGNYSFDTSGYSEMPSGF
ncbi:MAG: hypothetical protein GW772_02015 [Flavobacteriia bacterium]|nr:hypothetical protein [Flavobacteriia bacterium]OIP47244.1 MAG: hypothetical protein AUK46_05905 [Flavobacteriaceae bacterium CG2_30_31_66]PIV95992.1 MAG: hypothetical protein COW43_10070 [Flavobacteriaceae bacterium CG17_big_fil_post_rev_8_21_14_2_50_31_13]PIX14468.1 MAG: hypothetical protein COZ74_02935 [Flavobacteriaceae bacterium CG_4_8_14_3_um_filter_31_8]PIY14066.1 MAG: hypothetical protein COZ16_11040 [Flavobacteriaceae bacterium CG_4_10_14_3_um_filter_31_253]PIZ09551.1 MAG: hypotheti